ncbi:MAG: DDE-type integrase/transposase/recombinase, partial [Bacteroidales bacterium]|nr:DDE-type integrase/transposase/recombinase [Bacteroidales bacterium]MDY0143983.1 DDE-type integrase/transposase/recombinase [Bacteroidales bacterium]
FKINPDFMGRDKFEDFCKQSGFVIKRKKNHCITTDSSGVKRFPNLLNDLLVIRLNQVWQSDITYYEIKGVFYYITFIIDSYSRRIIGYSISKRLLTEFTTLPALKMAIRTRKNIDLRGLIFHSDGGGQYYADVFLKITSDVGIINSMCKNAYENGKAERVNGVIKNNYLKYKNIDSYEKLIKEVDWAVQMYNYEKPHIKLKRKTPIQFEKSLLYLPLQETATMKKSFGAKTIKTLIFEDIESSKIQGKKAAQNLNVFFAKMVEK